MSLRLHYELDIHEVNDMLGMKGRNTYPTYPNSTDPNMKFPRPTMTLPAVCGFSP